MMRRKQPAISQDQFDGAARAMFEYVTGNKPGEKFILVENDHWWVLARIALEGAGLKVPGS